MSTREVHWRAGGEDITCRVEKTTDHGVAHVAGQSFPFRILDSSHIEISGKRHRFYVIHGRGFAAVWLDGRTYYLERAARALAAQAPAQPATGEVRALMPGKIVRLAVEAGDTVADRQTVAIMESMKMESVLVAPVAGRVVEVRVQTGDVIDMGDVVMRIERRP